MSDSTARRSRAQIDDGTVTVVTTRKELESAFENLSRGDTIRITDENAPYRTTQWLDVDVDGVTVVGPGVRRLIKPADNAAVGGIRIGHNEACREVDVRGVGFRGTPGGKGEAVRLHGIVVRNATNVTLERNYVRRTLPVQHGDGGSGISVGRKSSNVRILNNEIHEFGDRGVQLAGQKLVVFGNVVTEGLDRPIACDLWYPDRKNRTAQSVSIFGNLLGNSVEGSLVGVARNSPVASNAGYVSIFGNVGFGSHKSFCHVRGPAALRNISIQNNVSRQETEDLQTDRTKQFAGIAVDVKQGRNLSIKNNELYDYSGHGVHVDSDISNVSVQHNGFFSPGLSGVRLVGVTNGLITGNLVTETEETGIRLRGTNSSVVRGNYVGKAGTAGIIVGGTKGRTGNDVADNYVVGNNQRPGEGRVFPAILVRDSGVRVRGNAVRQNRASAISEPEGTDGNVYEGNWADGEDPWDFSSSTSRTLNNTPPTDVHRGASADGGNPIRIEFDRPYARRPQLAFGRTGGGVRNVSYRTDGSGDYVGAEITAGNDGATIDVFVSEG
jgi:parallel beta-helix repeat protein